MLHVFGFLVFQKCTLFYSSLSLIVLRNLFAFLKEIIWFLGWEVCLFTGWHKVTVSAHNPGPPDAETCQGNSGYHLIMAALLHQGTNHIAMPVMMTATNYWHLPSLISFQLLSLLRLLRLSRLVRYAGQWEEVIVSAKKIYSFDFWLPALDFWRWPSSQIFVYQSFDLDEQFRNF